jgi:hypothetical protein
MQSDRFKIDLASPSDSPEILKLMEESPSEGNISLLFTRRPDPYRSMMLEGEEVVIVVARDLKDGKIAGMGACAIRTLYVNGVPVKVGYLFSMRVAGNFRGLISVVQAYNLLYEICKEKGAKYFIATILDGNVDAIRYLEHEKMPGPRYHYAGRYEGHAILPVGRSAKSDRFESRPASLTDFDAIGEFLIASGLKQLYPAFNMNDFQAGKYPGLAVEDFKLVADRSGKIVAIGALWDQSSYKQYIVKGYHGMLRMLLPVSGLFPILGYPVLPRIDSTLNYRTLSFWAVENDNPEIFMELISPPGSKNADYSFLMIGINERNRLRELLRRKSIVKYASRLYIVDFEKNGSSEQLLNSMSDSYLEYGML